MDKIVINAVGDSVVYGFGVEQSFVNIKNESLQINNFGINGNTSEDILNRIESALNCDILILFYGLNDFLNGVSVENVLENTHKILQKINTSVILCVPYKVDDLDLNLLFNSEGINRKLKKLNEEYHNLSSDVKILSFYELFKEDVDLFDGIHPTDNMHQSMRNELIKFLEENYENIF